MIYLNRCASRGVDFRDSLTSGQLVDRRAKRVVEFPTPALQPKVRWCVCFNRGRLPNIADLLSRHTETGDI